VRLGIVCKVRFVKENVAAVDVEEGDVLKVVDKGIENSAVLGGEGRS
jgi:hypothetical protein